MFGGIIEDLDDDLLFGHHMRSMHQMSSMMNSMFPQPFGGAMMRNVGPSMGFGNSLVPMGFPAMPNMNRLLNFPSNGGAAGGGGMMSYSSTSFVSMSQGGHVYQATSSSKHGPGGVKEVKETVQDSLTGVKKIAIGHHIGDRAHVIEREQNTHTGDREEREEFVNLDEDDADEFTREFKEKSERGSNVHSDTQYRPQLAIEPAPQQISSNRAITNNTQYIPSSRRSFVNTPLASPRRVLRAPSSPLTYNSTGYSPPSGSIHSHPYNVVSRRHRDKRT